MTGQAKHEPTRRSTFGDGCERCGKSIYNGRFCSVACARPIPEAPQETTEWITWRPWIKPHPEAWSPYAFERVDAIRVRGGQVETIGVLDPRGQRPEWNVADVWWRPA